MYLYIAFVRKRIQFNFDMLRKREIYGRQEGNSVTQAETFMGHLKSDIHRPHAFNFVPLFFSKAVYRRLCTHGIQYRRGWASLSNKPGPSPTTSLVSLPACREREVTAENR